LSWTGPFETNFSAKTGLFYKKSFRYPCYPFKNKPLYD
jgi:hypothetical protein